MKIKKTLLFSIIIFSLFSSLFSINSFGITPDINYTFNQDILFDDTIDSYNTSTPSAREPYNLRYQQEYTGIYNATYSFTNEIDGTNGTNIDFVDSVGIAENTSIKIIQIQSGHDKVLEFSDNSSVGRVSVRNDFIDQKFGTIEFWIEGNDTSKQIDIRLSKGSIEGVFILISANFFKYFNGSIFNIVSVTDSIMNHVKIDFECGNGNYEGLSNDTYFVYINTIKFGPFQFDSDINTVDNLFIITNTGNSDYIYYIDAIGYSFGGKIDFENDLIGSEPLDWNVQSFGTGIATVQRFQESNVFKIFDDSIHESVDVSTSFTQLSNQSIEYYVAINDTSLASAYNMIFTEGGSGRITLIIDNNDLDYHGGIIQTSVKDDFIIVDTWFKITIVLHDYTNTFDIYIDDILEGNNLNYTSNSTISIDGLVFTSDGVQTSTTYLDNFIFDSINFIDYNYSIGQNLLPYLNVSKTLMEVNRYEFALNDIHTFNTIGSSYFNGWNETELPSGNKVVIAEEPDASYDRVIEVQVDGIGENRGIIKNFTITDKIVNVSIGFYSTIMDGNTGSDRLVININSQDGGKPNVLSVKIYDNQQVWYYNGSDFVRTNWDIDLGAHKRYEFNFLFHYEINRVYFEMKENGVVLNIFDIYLLTPGHFGISQISFNTIIGSANTLNYFIDYVGVYSNGISQVEKGIDFGITLIDTEKVWNRENHNLFNFIGNGTFHIASTSLFYYYGRPSIPIKETTTYYNENQFINAYYSVIHLFTGVVVLTVLGNNFNFSYLKISGVILKDTFNSYNLIFEYSEVNIHESFFYVDFNNKLQFTHISNDTNTEYIQARFNINDTTSTDATISFRSLINNNAKGFFRINYTTTSDFIPFPTVQSTTSIFLTQGNNIRDFLIIITDLDDNNVNGLTSGFIDNIKLVFLGNIQISVITLSLIGMIIPLIIILTPTVALRDLYGESFVIPIFLLMSLILTIGQIIPIWLFFIIAISSSLFLIKGNMERDD